MKRPSLEEIFSDNQQVQSRPALSSIFGDTKKPFATQPLPMLPKLQQVEQRILQRPDAVQTLMQELQTPFDIRQHPIKKGLLKAGVVTPLKIAAVPFQRGEAGLSSGLLEAQRGGGLKDIGSATWKGVSGQRPAQLGDIIRTTGFGGWLNEPISAITGFVGTAGLTNLATKGKLVQGAKKLKDVATTKMQTISENKKNYVLNRAGTLDSGLDDLYKAFEPEYNSIYDKIGQRQFLGDDLKSIQEIIGDLPQNIISKINKSNLLGRTKEGNIVADMNNLKIIKGIIRQGVPDKIWNGKAIGDMNTAQLEQAYGKVANIMAKGNSELQNINAKYGDFMQMRKTISRVLYDADGNLQANGLINLFKKGGERGKQIFFEQFAKAYPLAKSAISDIVRFNRNQLLKKAAFVGGSVLATGGVGAYGLGRLLRNITGGGSSSYSGQ